MRLPVRTLRHPRRAYSVCSRCIHPHRHSSHSRGPVSYTHLISFTFNSFSRLISRLLTADCEINMFSAVFVRLCVFIIFKYVSSASSFITFTSRNICFSYIIYLIYPFYNMIFSCYCIDTKRKVFHTVNAVIPILTHQTD